CGIIWYSCCRSWLAILWVSLFIWQVVCNYGARSWYERSFVIAVICPIGRATLVMLIYFTHPQDLAELSSYVIASEERFIA
ncbi:hypothetical protein ACQWF0_25170, partial [Salmonella enterica subsp. enterica serovar Infantis]